MSDQETYMADIYCSLCGQILTISLNKDRNRWETDPCDICLHDAEQEAFEQGRAEG